MAATFPGQIEYTGASPSGRIAAVEAPVAPTGGLEAIAQGLQNLGQGFEKVQAQKDVTELSTMRRLFDENSYAKINAYSQTGDPEERKKIAEQWSKDVEGIQSQSERVNRAFQQYKDEKMPDIGQTFANYELGIQKKENKVAFDINSQSYLEQGNMPEYLKGLHTAYSTGIITKPELDYASKWSTANLLLAQMRLIADKDPVSAIKIGDELSSKFKLDEKHLNEKDNLIAHATGIANRQRVINREEQDKQQLGLYEKSMAGTLTWEDVKSSNIGFDNQRQIWENFKNAQAQKNNTGVSVIEEGDPTVLAKTYALVDLRPQDITPTQIYQLTDKGLGTKHIPALIDRLNRNQKQSNPVKAKYVSELSRLERAGVFGNVKKLATSDTAMNLRRKLDIFLETNPTEEQAQKFFSTLIRDDVHWIFLGDNLPGWEESPLEVEVPTQTEGVKTLNVNFGDIVEIDGQLMQAVGRKEGEVQWRPVKRR